MSDGGARRVTAIIPARFASTRFPGKAIATLAGKPLVYHTYLRTSEASLVSDVLVATDDERVRAALEPYRVPVVMTRADHPSGTDRIAEVARGIGSDIIVNVQGDEPLIDPYTIDEAIRPLLANPELCMSTARRCITEHSHIHDPNVVKVVCGRQGRALYFSRFPIPYVRDAADRVAAAACHWQHIGLYVYRRSFLLEFASWEPTQLELLEKLEQLRVLEHGYEIAVVDTEYQSIGVDTPEDLDRVRDILEGALEGSH